MPKTREGVKFLITNEWDNELAKELKKRGFRVFKITRRSAKSVKEELVAVNYGFKESPTGEARASEEVYPVHDTSNAGRGLGEAGRRLREGRGLSSYGDASIPERKVGRTGNTRLPDEIRDNGGRGGRGRFVRKTIILYSIFYKTPVCLALLYQANKSFHRLII